MDRIIALFAWKQRGENIEFDDSDIDRIYGNYSTLDRIYGADANLVRDDQGHWTAYVPPSSVAVYRISTPIY